jgi:UDP-N-acetyl-D-galactosamine dehydrogenase
MPEHLAERVIKLMLKNRIPVLSSRVLVLGLSFKENCPDLRNSKVIDFVKSMEDFGAIIDVYDPWISPDEAMQSYEIRCLNELPKAGGYDAIILAVAHQILVDYGYEAIRGFGAENAIFFDVKGIFPKSLSHGRL